MTLVTTKENEMERIAEWLGAVAGLAMRAIDWLTGRRRSWHEEMRK